MGTEALFISVATLLIGLGLGVIMGRFVFNDNSKTATLTQELEEKEQAFNEYQNKVGEHFDTTSVLVQELTQNYRKVYEHLSAGAQTLCLDRPASPDIELPNDPINQPKEQLTDGSSATKAVAAAAAATAATVVAADQLTDDETSDKNDTTSDDAQLAEANDDSIVEEQKTLLAQTEEEISEAVEANASAENDNEISRDKPTEEVDTLKTEAVTDEVAEETVKAMQENGADISEDEVDLSKVQANNQESRPSIH